MVATATEGLRGSCVIDGDCGQDEEGARRVGSERFGGAGLDVQSRIQRSMGRPG